MLGENGRELLLDVADQLAAELGQPETEAPPGVGIWLPAENAMAGILNSEDEALVVGVRRGLEKIAAALAQGSGHGAGDAARAVLNGAETVMRGELLLGNGDRLPALMPGFVFLIALPLVGQDRALELSRRTATIVERTIEH